MASTIWKGHLSFGLVSIPVKLHRAARAERVSFRLLHRETGSRVRQALITAPADAEPEDQEDREEEVAAPRAATRLAPVPIRSAEVASAPRLADPEPAGAKEIGRADIAKGYEYAKDQFVMLSKEELAKITPSTTREAQILEFVRVEQVDPIHFETSYYVAPDKGGERAYSLLYDTLRRSGFAGVTQLAMHNREHVAIVRPGRSGLVLHTMFYENEVRREDEYRSDTSGIGEKELKLALLLVENLAADFDASKYHDTYREKVEALTEAKIAGRDVVESRPAEAAPVVNILEALERSLNAAGQRKPPTRETPQARKKKER